MAEKRGRPPKYRSEFNDKVDAYVAQCIENKTIPWLEEIAYILDVTSDTITDWQKKHPIFSERIKKLKDRQAVALKTVGLSKNAAMPIFLLKANHGYIETEKIQHEGKIEVEAVVNYLPPKEKRDD